MGGSSKKKVTVGFKYYLGLHHIICVARKGMKLKKIIAGERELLSGDYSSNTQVWLNKPDLFGGEKKEGGIQGTIDLEFGNSTQGQNSYLRQHLGSLLPAYRGMFGVVLRKCYVTAMNPYMKPWWYLMQSCPQHWYPEKADINNGSANAAHIIHEILTQPAPLGQGISPHRLDDAAFRKFADTIYNEGFGLSLKLSRPDELDNFIGLICDHVDAMFFENPFTGLMSIKALRADYDPDSLIVLNADNSDLVSFERPSMGETVNTLTVTFRPRGQANDDAVVVHNLASITKQGPIPQGVNLPGIDNAANANRVALSRLRKMSADVCKFVFRNINPDTIKNFTIGDCVAVEFPSDGIKRVIVRVMKIGVPKTNGDGWTLEGMEDIFSMAQSSFIGEQEPEWQDPIKPPQPLVGTLPFEVPYWTIARSFDPVIVEAISDLDCFAAVALPQATFPSPNADVYTKVASQPEYQLQFAAGYCPVAKLNADYDRISSTFNIVDIRGKIDQVKVGTYAIIVSGADIEYVRVDEINQSNMTFKCGRGVLDSIPVQLAKGSMILFAEQFTTFDTDKFLPTETLGVKVCPRTGSGVLDLASAPTNTLTFVGRQGKPYPPANVKVNGANWPSILSGKLTVTWNSRNKKTQTATLIDWYGNNVTGETGTTYNIVIKEDGVIINQASGLTTLNYEFVPVVRNGVVSKFEITITAVVKDAVSVPAIVTSNYQYPSGGFDKQFDKYFNGVA